MSCHRGSMGSLFAYACSQCDYRAEVSGGPDSGFIASVETMRCENCRELVDVLTALHPETGPPTGDGTEEIGRCPGCGSRRVVPWREAGCPKCGARMEQGDLTLLWD